MHSSSSSNYPLAAKQEQPDDLITWHTVSEVQATKTDKLAKASINLPVVLWMSNTPFASMTQFAIRQSLTPDFCNSLRAYSSVLLQIVRVQLI